jgi:hypothetical protein
MVEAPRVARGDAELLCDLVERDSALPKAMHRDQAIDSRTGLRIAADLLSESELSAHLRKHGVTLVSVSEGVDESPSGQLVENIMASIAAFYSANLGKETMKGMRQKARSGGCAMHL